MKPKIAIIILAVLAILSVIFLAYALKRLKVFDFIDPVKKGEQKETASGFQAQPMSELEVLMAEAEKNNPSYNPDETKIEREERLKKVEAFMADVEKNNLGLKAK